MILTLLRIITFLSAFLLFQLELIIAKLVLPSFGGSYMVWGGCVVFFQLVLFLGYAFAHWGIQKFGFRHYLRIHLFLIFIPFFFFPGRLISLYFTPLGWQMMVDVFWFLSQTIGLVFFIISTMSILTQAWLSHSTLPERENPYNLFAFSNLGSFFALLTYPFWVEVHTSLMTQQIIWQILYIFLILLQLVGLKIIPLGETSKIKSRFLSFDEPHIFQWLMLSAAGVVMFLSTTVILTAWIIPMPLFWIIPLGIYLLSFVLVFKRKSFSPEWIVRLYPIWTGFAIVFFLILQGHYIPQILGLIGLGTITFLFCMYCQQRLYSFRPPTESLTFFYFIVSFGGFLGGILATWIVPMMTNYLGEFYLAFLLIAFSQISIRFPIWKWEGFRYACYFLALVIIWPQVFPNYSLLGMFAIFGLAGMIFGRLNKYPFWVSFILILLFSFGSFIDSLWMKNSVIHQKRNYYGIHSVYEKEGIRKYQHGYTVHGYQFKSPPLKHEPVCYYVGSSPIGGVLHSDKFNFKNLGVIGLGIGGLSPYLRAHQTLDFYEIDPQVQTIAENYFSYLSEAKGDVNVIIGDGRLMLEKTTKKYDIIIMDAFNGDAIPTHLITKEALLMYRAHLSSEGIILFNLSSRYFFGAPLITKIAQELGAFINVKRFNVHDMVSCPTRWLTLTWSPQSHQVLNEKLGWNDVSNVALKNVRSWTDAYSPMVPYLNLKNFYNQISQFNALKL